MAYVTAAEYQTITGELAPCEFDLLAVVADGVIDAKTLYCLIGRDVSSLPTYIQQKIKQAATLQIQYLYLQGGLTAINDAGFNNVSLGKFSYSTGAVCSTVSPVLDILLPVVQAYIRGVS